MAAGAPRLPADFVNAEIVFDRLVDGGLVGRFTGARLMGVRAKGVRAKGVRDFGVRYFGALRMSVDANAVARLSRWLRAIRIRGKGLQALQNGPDLAELWI